MNYGHHLHAVDQYNQQKWNLQFATIRQRAHAWLTRQLAILSLARMAESVDAGDSKSPVAKYVGSIPTPSTIFLMMTQGSIAAKICLYLKMHHVATRPQLQRELKVNEKGLTPLYES
ncbi:hypothetical protein [Burkholderia cepacia]|uniref:hypothetical protein n=1 Tax=Burkholderia cepacia TaxID=292 RepID=UPI00158A4F26|nr:hypothetical protein [Burkholderia cepacia]